MNRQEISKIAETRETSNEIIEAIMDFNNVDSWTRQCENNWIDGSNSEKIIEIAKTKINEFDKTLIWGEITITL